ncbi:putative nuclease HARBI1 [Saccostrea cucullata]|uniref:putative nuclease HARBI1 n=1 Tax=Saccostrea cuccullata TaxID=36930 RepID=UPI002ED4D537
MPVIHLISCTFPFQIFFIYIIKDFNADSSYCYTVCSAINTTVDNIKFPVTANELRHVKSEFYDIAKFPNCVGAIDGTLIPIKGMSGPQEPAFVCRKNFHALNIQAVTDSNMRFLQINTCFPGATHDSFVLSNSGLSGVMEHLEGGGWLLGDSGYPLKEWLLTPFLSPANQHEVNYNDAHGKTRVVIEKSFGVLKSRFRCLHRTGGVLPFSLSRCSQIIQCCIRLHNLAVSEKVPLLEGGVVQNINDNAVFNANAPRRAQDVRIQVANLF